MSKTMWPGRPRPGPRTGNITSWPTSATRSSPAWSWWCWSCSAGRCSGARAGREVRPDAKGAAMQCSHCGQAAAIYHVIEAFGRGQYGEVHLCEQCGTAWGQTECQQPLPEITNRERPLRRDGAARFVVARVIISEVHDQQVIMLQEAGGVRLFPLVSGIFEATALDRVIKSLTAPRPLAHDAWIATIRALSGEVQDVLVTDLREFIYYANLRI